MTRARGATIVVLVALVVTGCGDDEKKVAAAQDQTADLLLSCKKERDRLKVASEMCTKQLDEARSQTPSNEITVRLEGDVLKVYGDLRGAGMATEDATALSNSVINQVRGSRQALQQCYVSAMKKDDSIQARTIQGHVTVRLSKAGAVTGAAFDPRISDDFSACIQKVASRWKVPAYKEDRTVEVPITLQPG